MSIELERFHNTKELDRSVIERTIHDVERHLEEAAAAAQEAPDDIEAVKNLESTITDAATVIQEVAPQIPELAEEALQPLTHATEILIHTTGETPFRKAEIAARVAAKVHNAGEYGEKVVELANEQIDDLFAHTHVSNDEIGEILDANLADAYKDAIRDKRKFDVALGHQVAKAYGNTEMEIDVTSPLAQYRSDRAAEKATRKAHFERKQIDLEATGVTPVETTAASLEDSEEAIDEPAKAPHPDADPEAFRDWKKNLANKVTFKIGRTAMRDDENERIVTAEDIKKIRAELQDNEEQRAA